VVEVIRPAAEAADMSQLTIMLGLQTVLDPAYLLIAGRVGVDAGQRSTVARMSPVKISDR
jgi:hypothetical protein